MDIEVSEVSKSGQEVFFEENLSDDSVVLREKLFLGLIVELDRPIKLFSFNAAPREEFVGNLGLTSQILHEVELLSLQICGQHRFLFEGATLFAALLLQLRQHFQQIEGFLLGQFWRAILFTWERIRAQSTAFHDWKHLRIH